jgi:uncharacterized protein (TIGR00288 family)
MNIGIFVDGENISAKDYKNIYHDVQKNGKICIANVYLDWSENQSWKDVSKNFGLTPIQCNKIKKKNSIDLKITADIMETLYERQIELFCILTTDSDFFHVVQKLLSKNKTVHVYGYNSTVNQVLISICNQFIGIETLSNVQNKSDLDEYWEIINSCLEKKHIINISQIKLKIIEQYPSFNTKNYGSKRFYSFLKKNYHDKITFIGTEQVVKAKSQMVKNHTDSKNNTMSSKKKRKNK